MGRPIKNFDFILLTTKEYYFKYFWPVIVLTVIGSIVLGLWLDYSLTLRPDYAEYNLTFIELTGVPSIAASLITSAIVINPLVFYLLYRIAREYRDRRKLKFLVLCAACEKEYEAILQKRTKYDGDIIDEYLTYKAVMTADDYLWRNRMKNINIKDEGHDG